jgi:hypothetical protein
MATTNNPKNSTAASSKSSSAKRKPSGRTTATNRSSANRQTNRRGQTSTEVPGWIAAVVSVVGVGVAVGAGLYASRRQWLPRAAALRDDFSAAFADDETDYENFDQTRHAGTTGMRDHPGEDWDDLDDISDASFPASDPPSFNPGTA